MRVLRLDVDGIRNLKAVSLEPAPGINLILGENGAGKTSLLEALHCLSRGRSFRGGGRHEYLNRETRFARVVAQVRSERGDVTVGIERTQQGWRARAAGQELDSLGELAHYLPFTLFHPGLHILIEGPPEERRRFLDFGVFHVEPSFFPCWRRYRQALRQRNAALRQPGADPALWNDALVEQGEALTQRRRDHLAQMTGHFDYFLELLAPELCPVALHLAMGWPDHQRLDEALAEGLATDREQLFTRHGPHRADLRIVRAGQRVAGRLSRGQQKLVALAMMLAQARCLSDGAVRPVMGFDDLQSELDAARQERLLGLLRETGNQIWVTGTAIPAGADEGDVRMFHVEQGEISRSS